MNSITDASAYDRLTVPHQHQWVFPSGDAGNGDTPGSYAASIHWYPRFDHTSMNNIQLWCNGCRLTFCPYSNILLNVKTGQKRQFKNALYEQFARVAKALANPHRLELVELLAQGERTVEDLAREAAVPIANASQHLQVLRAAHLVTVRRDGMYAYYRLADERVYPVWQALRNLGEAQLADVDQLVRLLHEGEAAFVATLLAGIGATPPNFLKIVALNEHGELPAGDPTDLEAGANRCAIT